MATIPNKQTRPGLDVGAPVEVRDHFRGEWRFGFEIAAQTDDGYWIRRISDRSVLPVAIPSLEVRIRG